MLSSSNEGEEICGNKKDLVQKNFKKIMGDKIILRLDE